MAWFYLLIAGLLEVGWAVGLKYTHGFTRPLPTVLTGLTMVASLWFLAQAVQNIPIGTAYALWSGIGALGAAILGIFLFHEPVTLARALCMILLCASLIGLKLTSEG